MKALPYWIFRLKEKYVLFSLFFDEMIWNGLFGRNKEWLETKNDLTVGKYSSSSLPEVLLFTFSDTYSQLWFKNIE